MFDRRPQPVYTHLSVFAELPEPKPRMFRSAQSAFTFEILDYENPDGGRTEEEANLLLTCLRLMDRGRQWETITPLLHTWDMDKIVNWLTDIVADREVPDGLSFVEPCLAIELIRVAPDREHYYFAILLRSEAIPPWCAETPATPYMLSVDCNRAGICQAINGLTVQIGSFPIRSYCQNA
jgi:hypothetical protein